MEGRGGKRGSAGARWIGRLKAALVKGMETEARAKGRHKSIVQPSLAWQGSCSRAAG